jgi:hypothetical protein
MDRPLVERHLAQAEQRVSEGKRHIANQRELVAELERDGHPTEQACRLLAQFEEIQALYIADRDRVWAELAAMR